MKNDIAEANDDRIAELLETLRHQHKSTAKLLLESGNVDKIAAHLDYCVAWGMAYQRAIDSAKQRPGYSAELERHADDEEIAPLDRRRAADQPAATETLDPAPCSRCCGSGAEPPPGWVGRSPRTKAEYSGGGTLCHTCPWGESQSDPNCAACVAKQAPRGAPDH